MVNYKGDKMEKLFIGIGAYTGNGIIIKNEEILNKERLELFIDYVLSKNIKIIGAYKGDLGIYLEECSMVDYKGQEVEDLLKEYPEEEAFYKANVTGYTEIGDIKNTLSRQLRNLELGKGFTIKRLDNIWYLVSTANGKLIQ